MNLQQKRRLFFIVVFGVCIVSSVFLMMKALQQNINFYYTPSQLVIRDTRHKTRIRVGGIVKKGSVIRRADLNITFEVSDLHQAIKVHYKGMLPDLFKEGQGIIALGTLNTQHEFIAEEVLAKHDENYLPPEINS